MKREKRTPVPGSKAGPPVDVTTLDTRTVFERVAGITPDDFENGNVLFAHTTTATRGRFEDRDGPRD